ncbi:MAG: 3-deoxy-D-manno-octulosonic acid transferase [Halothiobacillus sp.]|jgi:3-deoxy-D-manno-octulosonic-acid transferase|nr:3-deoxy-D-manno-octulosonic acid transferase [Halothiobacillus sp.]
MGGWIYRIVLWLALPWLFIDSLRRAGNAPSSDRIWLAQWGRLSSQLPTGAIWLHAVSLGEVRAARPLVAALRQRWPEQSIMISTTTETGAQAARDLGVPHFYAPFDYVSVQRQVFRRLRPRVLILMETELWPNWLRVAEERAVPVILVNARLSDRSFARYQRWGGRLLREALGRIRLICTQSATDRARFTMLIAPSGQPEIQDCGNIKYDVPLTDVVPWSAGDRPDWLAASTHPGEEAAVLAAHRRVTAKVPAALLVLVPRHPERAAAIQALIAESGFVGQTGTDATPIAPDTQVFLLAQTGVLMRFFASIPVVFMGGSLVPIGGHNPIEPALFGRAVLTGPQTKNFRAIYQQLADRHAMRVVTDAAELSAAVLSMWRAPGEWTVAGERARMVVVENRGATLRILAALDDVLSAESSVGN